MSIRSVSLSPRGWTTLGISFCCTWVATAAMCFVAVGLGKLVDEAATARGFSTGAEVALIGSSASMAIVVVGAVVIGVAIAVRETVEARGSAREEARVRSQILSRVFDRGAVQRPGATASLATAAAEKMMALWQSFAARLVASVTAPIIVLLFMAVTLRWWVALVFLVLMPLVPAMVMGFRKMVSKVGTGSQDARKVLAEQYLEALQALPTLRFLGAAHLVGNRLADAGEKNRQAIMRLLKGNQMIILVVDLAFSMAVVIIAAVISVWQVNSGNFSYGQAVTLLGLSILLLEPMDHIGAFFYIGMAGRGTQKAIRGFLSAPMRELQTPSAAQQTDAAIAFDEVDFAYPTARSGKPSNKPVVQDLSFEISQGEKVALVGRSGTGKSTIIGLAQGRLAPTSGSISVASQAAVVQQHTWLANDTIAENLRLAKEDASEEEMWLALEKANLAGDIRQFPAGLATTVGENGVGLSGGQAQRLSLARALLSGRSILLLDEPTAQVDLASERAILAAIDAIDDDVTIVMATHRQAAAQSMDRVIDCG